MADIVKINGGGLIGVISGQNGLLIDKPFSKETFLTSTHVAGTSHVENIEELEKKLAIGTKLSFYREPDNEYDDLAIVIKDDAENKIGYVPKQKNEVIARLMDAGKLIYGVIEEKKQTSGKWVEIRIKIYLKD